MAKWKPKTYRKVIVLITALLLVGGMIFSATYGLFDLVAGRGSAAPETSGETGETAAVVNGVEIGRNEFEVLFNRTKNNFLQQGIELDNEEAKELLEQLKTQILRQMINNILLLQQAEKEGITPNEQEIQAQYEMILANFKDEEAFKIQLANANLTLENFKKEIAQSLTVEKYVEHYLEENVDEKDLVVTEEELRELYEQYSQQMEEPPEYEEMKPELLETLKNQKRQPYLETLVDELYEKGEIEIFE